MLTITGTTNGVTVDFNGYFDSGLVNSKSGYWAKSAIARVLNHGTYIEVIGVGGDWLLNLDGSQELLGVETVDGQTPINIDDLYEKLVAILV